MNGAREYAELFGPGPHRRGRLFLDSGYHDRGKTFHIYLMPRRNTSRAVVHLGPGGAVEVYGITGGQLGRDETYGWLHHGPWERDFKRLVAGKRAAKTRAEVAERERVAKLLEDYP